MAPHIRTHRAIVCVPLVELKTGTFAKALATGDMLCGGRLSVGLGVGGRIEDYQAVGADPTTQTMRGMADRVAVMKRVWAGEKITESVLPVGPAPVQAGGPPLLVGTIGPKTLRSAAAWADGLAGTTLDLRSGRHRRNPAHPNQFRFFARAIWLLILCALVWLLTSAVTGPLFAYPWSN